MTSPLPSRSIAVVLGTRPEIVKLAFVIRLLGDAAYIVHTGQHYDANLSGGFFEELELPAPAFHVGVGGASRGAQIGTAVAALDEHLAGHRPLAVVVQGDTNAVAAGAVAANAREVTLVHVEAGLRSFDRRMPEEHNRVITDHLADLCLAPTETSRGNLRQEGIPDDRIEVTGNTVVEAVRALLPPPGERSAILDAHGVEPRRFVVSTLHRPENVDDPDVFATILQELASLPVPVVLPLHPRSVARIEQHGLAHVLAKLTVIEPIGYREFLALGAESALLISDSGGVQEEASVYKRPVIVVRRSTERPEVIGTFAQRVLPGPDVSRQATALLDDLDAVHGRLAETPCPYGDGKASQRSVDAIVRLVG
jgi:UDP-N-acetylglucosamine 2-epimerase (non-hydrolysing)